ncbi:hypothetical protein ZWY2020_020627 [Hordeum vulgare]|nr:hypothetical protein ZWY2020_020627 [Hordeum vulgare]
MKRGKITKSAESSIVPRGDEAPTTMYFPPRLIFFSQDDSENNAPSTLGSSGFSTDRLPPNTITNRGATDPSSYSDNDGKAEVDPNVLPEDDGATVIRDEEEDDGEDLFNDDYLK